VVRETGRASGLVAEAMPRLCESCRPPMIIGTAAMATAMMHGVTSQAVAALIAELDANPTARLYDNSIAYQLAFRRDEALALQQVALAGSPLFRVRRRGSERAAIRLLALVAPGDLMANTPLDFITNHLDVELDLLFLVPGRPLPTVIPDHDVAFFAAGETDPVSLARLRHLSASWPRPVLNDPTLLPALARNRLSGLLAGVAGLCSPPTVEVSRDRLDLLLRAGGSPASLLPGCSWPLLIRPQGSHAGIGLEKLDAPADLEAYLLAASASSFYLSAFVDYRAPDGMYRKYRVAFIDRQPYLCHMAVSEHWMVHYLNAGMTESPEKRAEEARAMAHFDVDFAARHGHGFARLHELLPFDYYSIDCGETPDGRLLVFEADTAAIIHLMDSAEMFPYKHIHMRLVFDAFGAMLERRMAQPASNAVPPAWHAPAACAV
jgi:hypothetical protein